MECFWYLVFKVGGEGIGTTIFRNQVVIKYYNTLRMERITKQNTLTFLRILSRSGLVATRRVLGLGLGLGLAKDRPTKQSPISHCSITNILASIECENVVPREVALKPHRPCGANGIDFIYSEQNRSLTCTIRFSKIVVNEPVDATSRIALADITSAPVSSVYPGVWFKYNNSLWEVIQVDGIAVICSDVEDEYNENIQLPLNVVVDLVSKFGNTD
jgi:hypothetical protein